MKCRASPRNQRYLHFEVVRLPSSEPRRDDLVAFLAANSCSRSVRLAPDLARCRSGFRPYVGQTMGRVVC